VGSRPVWAVYTYVWKLNYDYHCGLWFQELDELYLDGNFVLSFHDPVLLYALSRWSLGTKSGFLGKLPCYYHCIHLLPFHIQPTRIEHTCLDRIVGINILHLLAIT
jgi:hypothetical protein